VYPFREPPVEEDPEEGHEGEEETLKGGEIPVHGSDLAAKGRLLLEIARSCSPDTVVSMVGSCLETIDHPVRVSGGTTTAASAALCPIEVVLFCGLQATGKSSFYRQRFSGTHVLVSRDRFRNHRHPSRRQAALIEGALREGRSVVVDNTNPTPDARAAVVTVARAHGARVRCFFFGRDIRASIARNARREGKERVPVVAILATARRLVVPTKEEGFDELWDVEAMEEGAFVETRRL
jgi:predicted kinase